MKNQEDMLYQFCLKAVSDFKSRTSKLSPKLLLHVDYLPVVGWDVVLKVWNDPLMTTKHVFEAYSALY